MPSQAIENPRKQLGPANIQLSNQFHEQAKTVTTLKNGQVLKDPHEKEKVSTQASRSLIIVYERKNNREENPNPNTKNEKKKHKKNELPIQYILKAPFPAALEANTYLRSPRKVTQTKKRRC